MRAQKEAKSNLCVVPRSYLRSLIEEKGFVVVQLLHIFASVWIHMMVWFLLPYTVPRPLVEHNNEIRTVYGFVALSKSHTGTVSWILRLRYALSSADDSDYQSFPSTNSHK